MFVFFSSGIFFKFFFLIIANAKNDINRQLHGNRIYLNGESNRPGYVEF